MQTVPDRKKIIAVLFIFVSVAACPFLYNAAGERMGYKAPEVELPGDGKECVESREVMRIDHKDLLGKWMTSSVRYGVRTYEARDGRSYPVSLVRTCMRCHGDKTRFCDHCHEYLAVSVSKCWDCHINPKQAMQGMKVWKSKEELF